MQKEENVQIADSSQENPEFKYSQPPLVNRFTASFIDIVILVVVIVGLLFTTGLVLPNFPAYETASREIIRESFNSQLQPAHLLPNEEGYQTRFSYENEFMARIYPVNEGESEVNSIRPKNIEAVYSDYAIIQQLAYFYCTYLSGNESRVREKDTVAISDEDNKDPIYYGIYKDTGLSKITYKGQIISNPKDFFTPEWFNKTILNVDPTMNTEGNNYFALVKAPDGTFDNSQIATVRKDGGANLFKATMESNPDASIPLDQQTTLDGVYYNLGSTYFSEEANVALMRFFSSRYIEAIETLNAQEYLVQHDAILSSMGNYAFWIIISIITIILQLVIPISLKKGQTLGRLFMKIGVVNRNDGYIAKKWQILLRFSLYAIVILLGFVFQFFIPLAEWLMIGIFLGIQLITVILVLLGKNLKLSVEDYFSNTSLADVTHRRIYKDRLEEVKNLENDKANELNNSIQPKINQKYDTRTKK